MKLNNNGWGYRDMVIYTCIILLALFFVAMSISSFYAIRIGFGYRYFIMDRNKRKVFIK